MRYSHLHAIFQRPLQTHTSKRPRPHCTIVVLHTILTKGETAFTVIGGTVE